MHKAAPEHVLSPEMCDIEKLNMAYTSFC